MRHVTYRKKLRDFKKALFLNYIVTLAFTRKNNLASIFKWLVAWKRSLPKTKFFFENLSPSSTLSYTITKKPKRVNLRRKSHWGSWSSWGSPLIALSLGFTVIRVLFRFLIERILFRVLSDRVFFESSEIGSSSLGHAVIDSSLHQCSFSAMSLFFYQIVLLLFLSKTDVLFCIFLILSKTITLTCFNNIRKTNSEKMKKYVIETQSIRWDQFNLLVNGPHRPYFKQKQKHNITKFWLTGFFLNLLFSAFWKKKEDIKHGNLI